MKPLIKELANKNEEFQEIIKELITNPTVLQMKNYRQHYETSCYDHCYVVAYYCFLICKKYHLDYRSATRASMLHDLFLYDWRVRQPGRKGFHAFTHGKKACENACELFDLNEKEKDMIIKHMWPITIWLPKSLEGFLLTLVDKYCALSETFDVYQSRLLTKQAFRFAYVFFSLMMIKI